MSQGSNWSVGNIATLLGLFPVLQTTTCNTERASGTRHKGTLHYHGEGLEQRKWAMKGQLKALSAAAFNHMHLMIMICLQGMSDAKVPATRVECSQAIWAMENGDRKNKITQWHALSQKGHTGFTCSVQRPDAWWQRSLRLFSMSIARPRES